MVYALTLNPHQLCVCVSTFLEWNKTRAVLPCLKNIQRIDSTLLQHLWICKQTKHRAYCNFNARFVLFVSKNKFYHKTHDVSCNF